MTKEAASIELQLLLLKNGAQLENTRKGGKDRDNRNDAANPLSEPR